MKAIDKSPVVPFPFNIPHHQPPPPVIDPVIPPNTTIDTEKVKQILKNKYVLPPQVTMKGYRLDTLLGKKWHPYEKCPLCGRQCS